MNKKIPKRSPEEIILDDIFNAPTFQSKNIHIAKRKNSFELSFNLRDEKSSLQLSLTTKEWRNLLKFLQQVDCWSVHLESGKMARIENDKKKREEILTKSKECRIKDFGRRILLYKNVNISLTMEAFDELASLCAEVS